MTDADFQSIDGAISDRDTDPAGCKAGFESGLVTAVKLYPAGATTNSASGVRNMDKVMPVPEVMAEIGMPLCVHGEVTDPDIDIFDREVVFIDKVLDPLGRRLPEFVLWQSISPQSKLLIMSRKPACPRGNHHNPSFDD